MVSTLLVLVGLIASTPAADAQVCINTNAPNPLEICVQNSGAPGVFLNQGGTRVQQYYSGYSWHSLLALNGTATAQMYATGLAGTTALTPVSNTLSGSGTVADPFVITTVLNAGATGVQVEQKFSYVSGDRYFKKRWTVRHTGAATYNNVRFFHGGDTYFGGVDNARSWWNAASRMVYVNNNSFTATGFMGFYASPVTPSTAYFGGNYSTVYQQMQAGQLTSTADNTFLDAGYALQWNRTTLTPGQTWVIEAFETWSAAGSLQVLPPSDDAAASGTTVRRRFSLHNLSETLASGTLALSVQLVGAPAGWSATLVGGSTLASLAALTSGFVDVDVTIPAGAAPGTGYEVRLTADPATAGIPNGIGAFKLSVLSNDISISPDPLAFGNVLSNTTTTRTITVENAPTGTPLRLGAIGLTNPLAAPFAIVGDTCSFNPVAPGASCRLTISFSPTSGAAVDDSFDVAILEPTASLLTVPVSGNRQIGGTFTVTPSAGVGGTISPATPQVVAAGATASFSVAPSPGFFLANVTGCGGTLSGTTFTIASVNTNCDVQASFYRGPVTLASTGADQSALLFNLFPQALAVTVRDANNTVVPNATVTFATPASGSTAFLSSTTAVTDAQGRAAISASANNVPGNYQVSATALGVVTMFDLTNVIQPARLNAILGTPQSAAICTAFATQLRIRVLDGSTPGVPVAEVPVTFSAPGTGASARLSATSVVTDSNGEASISATANSTTGTYNVTATVSGIAPVTFALTNGAGTPCNLPGAPTGVSAAADNGQATVSWTAPATDGGVAITDYQVTVSPAPGGGSATRNVGSTATSFVFTNLENGTAYTFTVRAINSVGSGPASSPSAAVTPTLPTTVPGVPTGVGASSANQQAVVSWTPPADTGNTPITGYSVQVATAPGGPFSATSCPTNSPAVSCTVGGLNNGVSYYFQVAAINAVGTGAYSSASAPVVPATVPGAVGAVSVTGGAQEANVSWTAPSDTGGLPIAGYQVQVATNPAGPFSAAPGCPAGSATTSCTATGLTNGTTYYFRVAATTAAGTGAFSPVSSGVTPATVPGAVSNVTGTRGNEQVGLTWTAPADTGGLPITGYQVQVGTNAAGPFAAAAGCPAGSTTAACTATGLTNGTTYFFRVAATTAAGTGGFSPVSAGVTPATTPGAVTAVSVTRGSQQVAVSWTAPADTGGLPISGYQVQVATAAGGPFSNAAGCPTNSTTPSCTATGLTNGTAYFFRVAAITAVGTGTFSAVSASVTPATVPGAVTNLAGTRGNQQVSLTWSAPADTGGLPITGYQVEVGMNAAGPFAAAAGCPANSATAACTATGLTNGTTYYFRVAATTAAGTGAFSPVSAGLTPATEPGAVTAVSVTRGSQQVAVSWTAPADTGGLPITGYQVQVATTAGGPFANATGCPTGSATTSCTATGLTNGTTYFFRVAAITGAGTGAFSPVSAGITPATVPGAVTNLSGTRGNQQVSLTWTAPADHGGLPIAGYQVEVGTSAGGPFASAAGCPAGNIATSCTATGLSNGSTHYFRVAAISAAGTGAFSPVSAGLTPATAPDAVGPVTVTSGNGQANVSWVSPSETGGLPITGYQVQVATSPAGPFTAAAGCPSSGTASSCTATGLTNGNTYYFRVAATTAAGTGAFSPVSAAVTPATTPGVVTAVSGTAGNQQVSLTWTAPAENGGAPVTGYLVEMATDPAGPFTPVPGCPTGIPAATCAATGLANGTTYYFRVAAQNSAGTGAFSPVSAGVTPASVPTLVTGLTATFGNQQATLVWTAPGDSGGAAITGYQIEAATDPAGPFTGAAGCPTNSTATTCIATGLVNGTTYYFRVAAINVMGTGPYSAVSTGVTPATVPGPVTGITTVLGAQQVSLTWSAPSDTGGSALTGYVVEIAEAPAGPFVPAPGCPAGNTTASCVATGLTNGTTYYFRIAAVNGVGTGPYSAVSSGVTPATLPDAVTGLAGTFGNQQVVLAWVAPSETGGAAITGYQVELATDPAGPFSAAPGCPTTSAVTTCTATGLTNGATYYFRVAALNSVGTGPFSAVSAGVTPATVPGVVTALAGTIGDRQVTLTWIAPAENGGSALTGYQVEVATDPAGPFGAAAGCPAGNTAPTCVATGLTNGTVYYFRVAAVNAVGAGQPAVTGAGVTPATIPGPVTDLAGTPGNHQVTLSWTAPADDGGSALIGYSVQMSTDAGGPFSSVPGCPSTGTATACVASGLTNGTIYYFRVAAVNGVGTGPYSNVSTGLTPATVPGPPTSITVIAANGEVQVRWTPPAENGGADITRYELQIATSPDGPFLPAPGCVANAAPSCTVTGLTNTTTYYFRVAATNVMGTGIYSEVSAGVTPVDLPGVPGAPTAVASSRSALVTVTPPSSGGEITSYTVTAYLEGTPVGTCTVTGATGSCTMTGLINGTRYVFRATAHNGTGSSTPSEPSAPVTPLAPGPTELTVISVIGNQVTLIWELPAEGAPDGYEALVGRTPGTTMMALPLGVGGDTDIYTTLAPGGIYYVRLRGKYGAVPSDVSNEVRIVIGPLAMPSAPEDLRTAVDGSALSLGWRPTFDGMEPTGMRVIARAGGTVVGQRDFGPVDNVTIPGVPTGEYDISVAALYRNMAGPESVPQSVSVSGGGECVVPGVPARLRVLVSKQGRILTAIWQPPVDGGAATSYRVLVEGAYAGAVDVAGRVLTAPAAPGVYHLRVVAQNACGVSAPTDVRSVVVQ